MCKECRNLPEGDVIKGHDHRIPEVWQLQNSIYILAKAIQDGEISGITKKIDKFLGEFPELNELYNK